MLAVWEKKYIRIQSRVSEEEISLGGGELQQCINRVQVFITTAADDTLIN